MLMRLKDYGKILNERKEYIHQSGLLISRAGCEQVKS
jgi:hypothetical protein